jgi:hypothetical protein
MPPATQSDDNEQELQQALKAIDDEIARLYGEIRTVCEQQERETVAILETAKSPIQ